MKPTRHRINSLHEDTREEHPAYAMVGASRVTGNAQLAGSDFRHQNYIVVRLSKAHLSRSLSNDRWFAEKRIVEFAMSEAQWATFVSSLNVGMGVPCTLQFTEGAGSVPRIEPLDDREKVFRKEVAETMLDAMSALQKAHDEAPTKKLKEHIAKAMQEIKLNIPFVVKQFDEHMEKTIEAAKVEVNAYITGAVQRAGLEHLGGQVIELMEGADDQQPDTP